MSDPVGEAPLARPADTASMTRRMLLELARTMIATVPEVQLGVFHDWLHALPFAATGSSHDPVTAAAVSLTDRLDRTTFHAFGDVSPMIDSTAALFEAFDADDEEMGRISLLGPAIRPDALGTWFESRQQSFNVGWTMTGALDLDASLRVVDDAAQRDRFAAFLGDHPAARITSVGRSVGRGDRVARVEVGLGTDPLAAVRSATRLLADLGAPAPADEILGAILNDGASSPIGVSLWCLDDGFARAAISVADPPDSLVVRLAMLGEWTDELERFAALAGALQADGASVLECFVDADGPGVTVTYPVVVALG